MKNTKSLYRLGIFSIISGILIINLFFYSFAFDAIVVTLGLFAIILKKEKEFLLDWTPPLFLFYIYELLRSSANHLAQYFSRPILDQVLIDWESKLFTISDQIPTVFLQYRYSNPITENFIPTNLEYFLFLFYTSFFWFWLVVGFVLWKKERRVFKKYIYGLIGFSIFSTFIYFLYPSAPPWFASQEGLLPEIKRTMYSYNYLNTNGVNLLKTYGGNDFAAFPSHHAAWPFFAWLFLVKYYGKKMLPLIIFPAITIFATWYGAEHYIIDSIAGIVLAGLVFVFLHINWNRNLNFNFRRKNSATNYMDEESK